MVCTAFTDGPAMGPLRRQISSSSRSTKMTMTKAGLVDYVYDQIGGTKKEAHEYVDEVIETMKDVLETGEELKVSGFGKFEVRHKGERVGRNPRTGVEITIPERKVLRFKVSQVLKDELNGER
jgi:integration host factor subunit alpha